MIIQELELQRLVQCPMMTPTRPSHAETCAYALAAWVLRQSFAGKLLDTPAKNLHAIRGKMLELWEGDKLQAGALARTAAFRLFHLQLEYEVIHLEQPYNLILSGYTIQGQYALLRKRTGEHLPHVLVLHTSEPELRREQALPPDVATMARYLHAYTNEAHHNAWVLHYPVFKGKLWFNRGLDVPLATSYLESMLKVAALRPRYPVAGEHCAECAFKPCLEVFNGRQNDDRR